MKNEPISRLMQAHTHVIGADDKVAAVEVFLHAHHLSWAPVVADADELIGVISLSDLLRFHFDKRDAAATAAWQLCSYRPITVPPHTPVGTVASLMIQHHIHHVVVTDEHGIRGVVSALDLVRALI